jgi:lipoyl(octanoyl) transferase
MLDSSQNIEAPTPFVVKQLGQRDYSEVWQAMQAFTQQRDNDTPDEVWFLEHTPVFTLGLNGKPEHILDAGDTPVIQCDRGGQVTYHGPGQLVVYTLLDLQRRRLGVKLLVDVLEQVVIDVLGEYNIRAERKIGAPGVYVDGAKIAALGLRVRRGCSYHGLSLNLDMDLSPFQRINPCGYAGLAATSLKDLTGDVDKDRVIQQLLVQMRYLLQY